MSINLNETPSANRCHIAFFGNTNSGKSSLINAFTKQTISIVSSQAGTTTDPVYKAIEIHGLGASVLIDTAGFNDVGELGELRIKKTKEVIEKTDIAVLLFADELYNDNLRWFDYLKAKNIPTICLLSKADIISDIEHKKQRLSALTNQEVIIISAKTGLGLETLKEKLISLKPQNEPERKILSGLVSPNDVVVLVMPQNIQAPQGRLILPQVQTIRELLDTKCTAICTATDRLDATLKALNKAPDLIITDSQDFKLVAPLVHNTTKLTSFSILFAAYKGDISYYLKGTEVISTLKPTSKILIAECCSHVPLSEDIGREKIPTLLRKKFGYELKIQIVSGNDFPKDLTDYDLIIQCGGCMFNRQHILSRIEQAKIQSTPMTNYGLTLAFLQGLPLKSLALPK